MDIGKLLVFGILGFLLLSLWQGGSVHRELTPQSATVIDTEIEETEAQPITNAPRRRRDNEEVSSYTALRPAYMVDSEADERVLDTYATYEYIRDRDPGTENTYSYRVEGENQYGVYVEGSVNTRGVTGKGYVTTEDGDHYWIVTEWTPAGELLGFDDAGNTYFLVTSEIR